MLSNSVIGGALASAYLTVLVLHLNPLFPLTPGALVPLSLALGLAYGVNIAVAFYAMTVIRQLLAAEVLSPGWISVRLLSWLCTFAASGGAVIMWLNLRSFAPVLDLESVRRMTAAAAMITGSAGVFLLIALAHLGRRGGGPTALLLMAAMALSIVAPLGARGWGESALVARSTAPMSGLQTARPGGRVVLIMLEGASLDVISPAVAEGRLPNFGRILDAGSVLHLATLRPTQAEPVWSAAATARVPVANGVRAAALYRVRASDPALSLLPDYCFAHALVRFGFLLETRHDSRSLQARPLWSILSGVGVSIGIIGWPLTHPAPPVNGYLVSDRFHAMTDAELDIDERSAVSPPELTALVRNALTWPASPDPVALVSRIAEAPGGDADAHRDPQPIIADRVHLQILGALEAAAPARFVAVRFPGLDAVGHYFLRYATPAAFGDVSDEERRRYGRVLAEYYGFVDTIVGRALDALGPEDLLLVVSGFGMQPLSPGKRILERLLGDPEISGSHERAPDGFLMAHGAAVAQGRPPRASVLDLAPTILYYLGLPVARDMDGFARTDIFRATFTAPRPITFIPTYGR